MILEIKIKLINQSYFLVFIYLKLNLLKKINDLIFIYLLNKYILLNFLD